MNESKENIINAALSLFMHNSYASVSMRDILDKAGLSRGAFYHYFESKEACFKECVKYYLAQVTHPEPADYTSISLKEFLEDNIRRMYNTLNEIGPLDRLLFLKEAFKIITDFAKYIEHRNMEELAVWTKVVKNAVKSGEIKSNIPAKEIAGLFITQCDGVLLTNSETMDNSKGYAKVEKQWNNLYSLLKN